MRRRKAALKLGVAGVLAVAAIALLGALAMAQPGPPQGVAAPGVPPESQSAPASRAARAAGALADAHGSDRAVGYLADIAQREISRVGAVNDPVRVQALDTFSQRAEQHLISESGTPEEARELLRGLIQQLRGSAAPVPPAATPDVETAPPGEVNVFGRNVEIEAGRTVETASVVGGDLAVRGHVLQDAVAVGGDVTILPGGRVDGDAVSVGGNVRLDPGARVEGDAVSIGGRSSIAQGAYVGGDRTQVGAGALTRPLAQDSSQGGGFARWVKSAAETIGFWLVMALLFIVIAAVAPNRTRNVVKTVRRRPVMSFFAGILAVVVMVLASAVLLVTVIGIPLIPVLWACAGLAVLFGLASVSALVGEAMPGKKRADRSALKAIILGAVFMAVVSFIPWGLGVVILVVLVSAALGAVIVSRLGAQ